MSESERRRVLRIFFRATGRALQTTSSARSKELWRLAERLAERLAGHDRPNLFGGIR